ELILSRMEFAPSPVEVPLPSMLSPFLVPPPTSIRFKPPSTNNHHSLLAQSSTLLCFQIGT
ncbi:hypothetical protein A2U01_0091973, partial [Trifolium medium]|nr:hypothetical protein [Trifolium medium]